MGIRGGNRSRRACDGFTLVELVVVMALIAFLAIGIGWALGGGNDSARLRAGEVTLANYLQRARAEAVLQRSTVRVLLRDDSTDREHHLRQLGAVVEIEDHGTVFWKALDDGALLPEGVYCWEPASSSDWAMSSETMQLEFPLRKEVAEGSGETWRFLEIEPNGSISRPGELILQLARWDPETSQPIEQAEVDGVSHQIRLGLSRLGGLIQLDAGTGVPQ